MGPSAVDFGEQRRPIGPMGGAAWLLAVYVVAWAITSSLAYFLTGPMGFVAASAAAGICLTAVLLAWFAQGAMQRGNPLTGLLFAMAIRMGFPLAACVLLVVVSGPLIEAGVILYMLVFYLIGLAVETWMSVAGQPQMPASNRDMVGHG